MMTLMAMILRTNWVMMIMMMMMTMTTLKDLKTKKTTSPEIDLILYCSCLSEEFPKVTSTYRYGLVIQGVSSIAHAIIN